jgi:hypothetical protein
MSSRFSCVASIARVLAVVAALQGCASNSSSDSGSLGLSRIDGVGPLTTSVSNSSTVVESSEVISSTTMAPSSPSTVAGSVPNSRRNGKNWSVDNGIVDSPLPATNSPIVESTTGSAPSGSSSPGSVFVFNPTPTTASVAPTTTATSAPGSGEVVIVIPLGTKARIDAGQSIDDVMPLVTNARVGQTFVMVNQDTSFHVYGPLSARPGETIRYLLSQAGDLIGACTVPSRTITIRVSP